MTRTNATCLPSGENAGLQSPTTDAGGDVRRRFSPVSGAKRKRLNGSSAEVLSLTTSHLPSGDQCNQVWLPKPKRLAQVSVSLRSAPPSAGTRKIPSPSVELR